MGRSAKAGGGLSGYLRDIQRFQILERQEEIRLAMRWQEHGDRSAAEALVSSHLRLVPIIAKRFGGYGLPISDLISEGNVGLMRALDRFEPQRGFRFSTYAVWWIRSSMQDYILRSRSAVNAVTTAHRRKLFFKLNDAKAKIGSLGRDLRSEQVEAIARMLGVGEQDVVDMNGWLSGDASLNAPQSVDVDGTREWQDSLIDEHQDPETAVAEQQEARRRQSLVTSALSGLKERDKRIFEMRWLVEEPLTLKELGKEFGISRERVRQIEAETFKKVREALVKRVEEDALQPVG